MSCIDDKIAEHDARIAAARAAKQTALENAVAQQSPELVIAALKAYLAAVKASCKQLAADIAGCPEWEGGEIDLDEIDCDDSP